MLFFIISTMNLQKRLIRLFRFDLWDTKFCRYPNIVNLHMSNILGPRFLKYKWRKSSSSCLRFDSFSRILSYWEGYKNLNFHKRARQGIINNFLSKIVFITIQTIITKIIISFFNVKKWNKMKKDCHNSRDYHH